MKYDLYIQQVIKQYDINLLALTDNDTKNLFSAIQTIVSKVESDGIIEGKRLLSKQIKDSVNDGKTIFEIYSDLVENL